MSKILTVPGLLLRRPGRPPLSALATLPSEPWTNWTFPGQQDIRSDFVKVADQGKDPDCVSETQSAIEAKVSWSKTGKPLDYDHEYAMRNYRTSKAIDGDSQDGTYPESSIAASIRLGRIPEGCRPLVFTDLDAWKWCCHKKVAFHACFEVDEGWFHPDVNGFVPSIRNTGYGHDVTGAAYAYENKCGYKHPEFYGVLNSWGRSLGAAGFYRFTKEQMEVWFRYGVVIEAPDGSLYG